MLLLFFFSSRRRHTRCSRDWSSDVCSSDLNWEPEVVARRMTGPSERGRSRQEMDALFSGLARLFRTWPGSLVAKCWSDFGLSQWAIPDCDLVVALQNRRFDAGGTQSLFSFSNNFIARRKLFDAAVAQRQVTDGPGINSNLQCPFKGGAGRMLIPQELLHEFRRL